jgi:hypothetical protein
MRRGKSATGCIDSAGLKASKIIAQGKSSLRATPWVKRPNKFSSPERAEEFGVLGFQQILVCLFIASIPFFTWNK